MHVAFLLGCMGKSNKTLFQAPSQLLANRGAHVGLLEVSISRGTVKHIYEYFEMAEKQYMDEKVLNDVKASGRIILSLDGAHPVKNEPSLWIFSDHLTGHILFTVNLNSAQASKLQVIFEEIEEKYGVAIVAVVSDKKKI